MKIVFAVRDRKNFIGGPAADAVRLLLALRKRGHEVHALGFWVGSEKVHSHLDKFIEAGIPCHIIRKHTFTKDGIKWILERMSEIKPDIFIAGLSTEGCYAARWLVPAGIPVVNVLFGNDALNLGRSIYFSNCPVSWRVSGHAVFGETLEKKLHQSISVHIPTVAISSLVEIQHHFASYAANGQLSIVYAGRLVEEQKRTGDMIQAMIAIGQKHPQLRFHLIGDAVAGERANYEKFVIDHAMQDRILFHGILHGQTYLDELAKHQIILLLSDHEGIPGSVIDGMSAGLVPVCLYYEGLRDLVTHQQNGWVVHDRDQDVENALVELATNRELWTRLSINAREYVKARFSSDLIVDKWETFLSTLTNSHPRKTHIDIPGRIVLPRKSNLLMEENRRLPVWKKLLKKLAPVSLLIIVCCLLVACKQEKRSGDIVKDKDAALAYLKEPFLKKPFEDYHMDTMPDAEQCLAFLDDQGVFMNTLPIEQGFLQNLDSFYTVESASFQYSRFLLRSLSKLWRIAETYRGKTRLKSEAPEMEKLLRGIIHYGSLELARPGNRFQHKYSDFQTCGVAINMYFCLFPLMEEVRLSGGSVSDLQQKTYETLTQIGLQSWTVPPKNDETDKDPIQLKRFTGHTWWINGNALEFRPAYACALMMHSEEMVDIIATLVTNSITALNVSTVDTAFWREGITVDGGAWTYGRQNRPWMYPFRGISGALKRMRDFRGTPWEIPMTSEKIQIVIEWIRGSSFFHYKGLVPPCLDRQNFNFTEQEPQPIPSDRLAVLLLDEFPELLTREQDLELKIFLAHTTIEAQKEDVEFDTTYWGTRYFYCNEDLIRKTQDYYVYVNMASHRVDGIESAVQYADIYNFFGADGATFFLRSGDEAHKAMGAFELTSHPGVTARHGDEILVPGRNLMGHCSRHNFAAGVVSDSGSCAGFIFEKTRGLDKYAHWKLPDTAFENDQEWIYGVQAYKSYFLFGDIFAALGCGITNKKTDLGSEIRTTIEQTLVKETTRHGTLLEAGTSPQILLKEKDFEGDTVILIENNGFVYQIMPEETPGDVWVQLTTRPTRWDELNILNRDVAEKSESADIFQLWINHGASPVDDRYGYLVYCNPKVNAPPPQVLMNTKKVQAMCAADSSIIQAVFYEPQMLRCGVRTFEVSAPCAFSVAMYDEHVTFTISDAKMDPMLDAIEIRTNIALEKAQKVGKLYQVSVELPKGLYKGKQAVVNFEKLN